MTKLLAEHSPAEIDAEIARLLRDLASVHLSIVSDHRVLASRYTIPTKYPQIREHIASLELQKAAIEAELVPLDAEYERRGGWSRAYLVTNSNGHVHSGTTCVTCYPTTEYTWLTAFSGATEAELIAEVGERACTVCYPEAPVDPDFHRPGRMDQVQIDARQAEKEAKATAKAAKSIVALDGSPLRVPGVCGGTEILRTKIAARNALSGAIFDLALYGDDHPSRFGEVIEILVPVLKANGLDTAKIMDAALKRARRDARGNESYWHIAAAEKAAKNHS